MQQHAVKTHIKNECGNEPLNLNAHSSGNSGNVKVSGVTNIEGMSFIVYMKHFDSLLIYTYEVTLNLQPSTFELTYQK